MHGSTEAKEFLLLWAPPSHPLSMGDQAAAFSNLLQVAVALCAPPVLALLTKLALRPRIKPRVSGRWTGLPAPPKRHVKSSILLRLEVMVRCKVPVSTKIMLADTIWTTDGHLGWRSSCNLSRNDISLVDAVIYGWPSVKSQLTAHST